MNVSAYFGIPDGLQPRQPGEHPYRAADADGKEQREGGVMETLGEALPKEMARVRDELMPMYQSIGPAGGFALALMRNSLDKAAQAMAAGDLPMMIRAYEELKSFKE